MSSFVLTHDNPQRNPRGVYVDDHDDGRRADLPEEVALLYALRRAIRAALAVLDAHDETSGEFECDCVMCYDARGVLYNLRGAESLLFCQLHVPSRDEEEEDEPLPEPSAVVVSR